MKEFLNFVEELQAVLHLLPQSVQSHLEDLYDELRSGRDFRFTSDLASRLINEALRVIAANRSADLDRRIDGFLRAAVAARHELFDLLPWTDWLHHLPASLSGPDSRNDSKPSPELGWPESGECVGDSEARQPELELGLSDEEGLESLRPDGTVRSAAPDERGSVSGEPPPAPPVLVRYPELDFPPRVPLEVPQTLTVSLLVSPPTPGAYALPILSFPDPDPEPPEIEIVVRAPGFDIQGGNTRSVRLDRSADTEVRFKLTPMQPGPRSLRVDFYQEDRRIGTLRHETKIVSAEEEATSGGATAANEPEVLELTPPGAIAPDLEICVELVGDHFSFTLHGRCAETGVSYHHQRMGDSMRLHENPKQYFQTLYRQLGQLAGPPRSSGTDDRCDQLATYGRTLWDQLFSERMKLAFYEWKNNVRTLLITSDEPWVPWEIVKPYRFDDTGTPVEEPFLCESFEIARWLSGPGPVERVPAGRLRPVAPASHGVGSVEEEVTLLNGLQSYQPGLLADPPYREKQEVVNLFKTASFSVAHFVSHGRLAAGQLENTGIVLDDGTLYPSDIVARFGGVKGRPRPLVFFNACYGAAAEYALTGLGGWASRLVCDARVGAFIGAAWEVDDRLALLFAKEFYTALLQDRKSVALSLAQARRAVRNRDPGNSTWLAYVLYADPRATVA